MKLAIGISCTSFHLNLPTFKMLKSGNGNLTQVVSLFRILIFYN
jgi:hypothetical protein